jgi:phosphatidylserine/phosphatidylglycerophosphate/cardiolipin synthase-like enzyme
MSHLKAALIDGWSCFGSANLDKLSLRLNLETNLASSDPGVANALLTQLFEPDFTRSRELDSPPTRGFGNYLVNVIADHL